MSLRRLLPRRIHPLAFAWALGAALTLAATCPAHATHIELAADGAWQEFTVDNLVAPGYDTGWIDPADGSALDFDFTVAAGSTAQLTVVDAGFAGDTFTLTNFGASLGQTSSVAAGTTSGPVVFDFDAALADPSFSRGVFTLTAGSYRVGGRLAESVLDGGVPLDATNGAVRLTLTTAAVPEPSTFALLAGGLGLLGFAARRRGR